MERPRIKIKLSIVDFLVEIIGLAGVMFLIIMPLYFYNELTDSLPQHFDIFGKPDLYSEKWMIWLLPVIGLVMFAILTILNKFPYLFNYPVKVTSQNAERLYTIGTRSIRALKLLIISMLLYLNYKTIQIGLNKAERLDSYFLLIFLVLISLLIGVMLYKMFKK